MHGKVLGIREAIRVVTCQIRKCGLGDFERILDSPRKYVISIE